MKQIAILGPTASGKTALSLELANKYNCIILSLDSLSVYKEIDIASAKPTKKERGDIVHFGIDAISVDESFDVTTFFELYKRAKEYASKYNKNLIIVGGTGFYLKSMMEGLSQKPKISIDVKQEIKKALLNLPTAYSLIEKNDPQSTNAIKPTDSYRIEKWLEIYLSTGMSATEYFLSAPKKPLIKDIDIYEIDFDRDFLRERIKRRTSLMVQSGLIDEVVYLEKKYTRNPNAMSSIGIKETLEYLDGYLDICALAKKISINTAKLAKRQRTFNASQFPMHIKGDTSFLKTQIIQTF